MNHEERATHLLQGYFRMLAERIGIRWDSEMDAEIASIVEHVIAAAQADSIPSIADTVIANADARRFQ